MRAKYHDNRHGARSLARLKHHEENYSTTENIGEPSEYPPAFFMEPCVPVASNRRPTTINQADRRSLLII